MTVLMPANEWLDATMAQSVGQLTTNPRVSGSIPGCTSTSPLPTISIIILQNTTAAYTGRILGTVQNVQYIIYVSDNFSLHICL